MDTIRMDCLTEIEIESKNVTKSERYGFEKYFFFYETWQIIAWICLEEAYSDATKTYKRDIIQKIQYGSFVISLRSYNQ